MNDDLTFLASAYLDGDITPDERARVEADPDALAEVDRLRTVRFLLGDVEPPSISVREAHLASALDAWSRVPEAERTGVRRDSVPMGVDAAAVAGAASVTATTSRRADRRRTTSTRWLSGAAAGLVLVLAGGLALQLRAGGEDDSSTSSEADIARTEAGDSSDAAATDERLSQDQADTALAPASEATNELDAQLDTGVADPAPPGEEVGLARLQTPSDLADFAAAAVGAPVSPDVPAATSAQGGGDGSGTEELFTEAQLPLCLGVDLVVGPAVYGDTEVVVGIDERLSVAIAYRAATCDEVARVRLP